MLDKLLSCPFPGCNGDGEMIPEGYNHEAQVTCKKCARAVMGESGTLEDAIAAWNALPRGPQWTTYAGEE